MKLHKFILTLTCVLCTTALYAQELEYRYELGGMLGSGFYLGDANYSSLYKNNHLSGGLLFRYNLNPRMALKFDLMYSGISGNALELQNKYPNVTGQEWKFSNSVIDLGCQYELGFWGYGTGRSYKGTKRLVPYIQIGMGFTYGNKNITMNIPIGFGVKYKLKERLNIGFDWSMHFSMSDKLDGISDPYSIKSGFLKNKDSYCLTKVYLSFDLSPRFRECNND